MILSFLEVKQGALLARHKKDIIKANVLEHWIDNELLKQFGERILPITQEIYLTTASLHIPNQRDRHDALIAGTSLVHDLIVVTHNLTDFNGIDNLTIFNPFST